MRVSFYFLAVAYPATSEAAGFDDSDKLWTFPSSLPAGSTVITIYFETG